MSDAITTDARAEQNFCHNLRLERLAEKGTLKCPSCNIILDEYNSRYYREIFFVKTGGIFLNLFPYCDTCWDENVKKEDDPDYPGNCLAPEKFPKAPEVSQTSRLTDVIEIPVPAVKTEFINLGKFVTDYVLYAKDQTDAPLEFHLMMAKNILANIIGKRIFINFSHGKQYLNQYNIIVAPPSARKTATYNIGRRLFKRLDKKDIFLPEQCTPESLAEILSLSHQGIYISDEFSIFLNDAINKTYGKGIIGMIVKLYDTPDDYTLARRENSIYISNPYLSFMTFIQNTKYYEYFMNEESIGLGFPQRFEVLLVKSDNKRPRRQRTKQDIESEDLLVDMLKNIDKMLPKDEIEAKFSKELDYLIFEEIEKKYDEKWKDNVILANFPARLADQIYKNSVLVAIQREYLANLAISKFSILEYINIQKSDVLTSINFTESKIVPSLEELSLLNAKNAKYADYLIILNKVKQLINSSKALTTRSKVLQNLHLTTKEWSEFSKQMVEENILEIHPRTNKNPEYYTLK